MPLKSYRPKTPSRRYATTADFSVLTPKKDLPQRPSRLRQAKSKSGGRNSYGRITSFRKSGGHKQAYRVIDFKRDKNDINGKVVSIEYDPNRSSYIALISYVDGDKRFILAPVNLKVGDSVIASDQADIQPGNCLPLDLIPMGTLVHNIELEPGRGGKMVRAAGGIAQLVAKEGTQAMIKLPSGEIRKVNRRCKATIGQLSNLENENITIGKAGRNRWRGIKPTVRGVVMNPVDHPMGGGEGKASGGHPRSPWGQKSKGLKTRNNKRTDGFIVRRRNKKK